MSLSSPGLLSQLSHELEDLVAKTAPSVVAVEQGRGQGTGVVIAGDGYVLTNSHVVRGDPRGLRVRLPTGDELSAELVGDDPESDLAVLRVSGPRLTPLELHESRRLRVGQLVVAIGNPLRFEGSVTLGVVSALERALPGPQGTLFEGLVQTDAAINPGNSGGPLLDATGAVVGINTAVIPQARGLGFAIAAHTASWIAAVLMRRGRVERPLLGVAARGVDLLPSDVERVGQARAVRIHAVSQGSAAARAGLVAGDLLLTAGGSRLFGVDDLKRALVLGEGQPVLLEVQGKGARRAFTVAPDPARVQAA
ncbi:MAG TPA: trypsin-like peptidase domain-containing protein [Polyangiaceae bacterium]|nr:trypsin-like peptidase domain-containing protein [Polyangiaceae bacterium]